MGQSLGCSGTPPRTAVTDSEQSEAAANGDSADANGSTGNAGGGGSGGGTAEANSNPQQQQQQQPRQGKHVPEELFALSNTEDNESIQGLVRSGGCLWIGRFRLPPARPGEDKSEVRKGGGLLPRAERAASHVPCAGASKRRRHASLCFTASLMGCVLARVGTLRSAVLCSNSVLRGAGRGAHGRQK